MTAIYSVLGYPLGWLMWLCSKIIPVYAGALILFTIITKAAIVPLSIKQQKSMAKLAAFRPKQEEIQKKYASNRQKLNEELAKMYQEEGYNPMSGCLPALLPLPILFGLIDVIYKPLTHIVRLSSDIISSAQATAEAFMNIELRWNNAQLNIINLVKQNPDAAEIFHAEIAMMPDFIEKINNVNLNFLGVNLGDTPTWAWPLVLIPILSGVTSLLLSLISMRNQRATTGDNAAAAGMTRGMMLIMPVFSVMIAFQVPAGVGFYWLISNILAAIQTTLLYKFYNPAKMAEAARLEMEQRKRIERQERIEAKIAAKSGDEEATEKALSQKELNRRKLIEARKRDAEKYGEAYSEED